MREMDYRAWDGEKFWYLEPNGWFLKDATEGEPFAYAFECKMAIDQYAGLNDRNGVKIYEKDHVQPVFESFKGEVHFSRSCFKIKELNGEFENKSDSLLHNYVSQNIKVVGNMYQTSRPFVK